AVGGGVGAPAAGCVPSWALAEVAPTSRAANPMPIRRFQLMTSSPPWAVTCGMHGHVMSVRAAGLKQYPVRILPIVSAGDGNLIRELWWPPPRPGAAGGLGRPCTANRADAESRDG